MLHVPKPPSNSLQVLEVERGTQDCLPLIIAVPCKLARQKNGSSGA